MLRDRGTSLLFLSANTCCWVTPLLEGRRRISRAAPYGDHGGSQRREREWGPFPAAHGPDEGLLMGGRNGANVIGCGDWRCEQPEHWLFEGTGMEKGEAIPGLVGWE